ncbi:MAG: pyridoxal-phosphate dependent enzyme, partial [Oscillospiraceae bacterium]|nr:pyridoxal-phosphate dependent enzyme [Oscillospiraceae bacterium]
MITLDKIYHAKYVLSDVIRETDVIYAPHINEKSKIYLKTENLQITGSFKVRGAYYKMSQLSDEEKARGVVACSAGNHAQGVAYAAQAYGVKAIIVMPTTTPLIKVNRTKNYGAEVIL